MDESVRAGIFAIMVVVAPGTQGLAVTGIQGLGVKTPNAAAVKETVVGFDRELQVAKVGILTRGV